MLGLSFLRTGLFAILAACVLIACGGGGGGGGSTVNTVVAETPWVAPTGAPVTVSGVISYERVGINPATGALDYNNIAAVPVRGATVLLIYKDRSIATTQSSASGQYTFTTAPAGNIYSIIVLAELKQTTTTPKWDVTVRDNTSGDGLYGMQSIDFSVGATGATRNVLAGSGWSGGPTGSYTQARVAAPFAILDTIYESQQKVLSAQSTTVFPLLKVFWSVKNKPSGNNIALGDIGTSFFQWSVSGGVTSRSIYILGLANVDTDEYDSSVVAHEWGHYYQSAFSRDDSMGGSHGNGDDRLDRRLAFSEGWGNALSGIVLSKSIYTDSRGNRQSLGFVLNLSSGYPAPTAANPAGWFRESSIQYILWDLSRQAGFTEIHQAMSSNAFKNGSPLTDIHSFSSVYRSLAAGTKTAALNALLGSESINNSSDAYGSSEANNGGKASTLPYYRQLTSTGGATGGQTLCSSSTSGGTTDSASSRNKLAYLVYARVTPNAGFRTITVTANNAAADVDFQLYKLGQLVVSGTAISTQPETRQATLTADEHILVIQEYDKVGDVCYTVTIN